MSDGTGQLDSVALVELSAVRYSYGAEGAEIGPLDLRIGPGEFVGLLGPSGAGKSTLAHLLLGLRRPSSGSILINGAPLESYASSSVRSVVAFVPQQVGLMTGTLRENVTFYRRQISDEVVIDALVRTGLWQELGEDLSVRFGPGERAVSGGQLQRLGLARAIAGDAKVLVLDEPTSSLDPAAEAQVLGALNAVRGSGLAALVISHREAPIAICDRVVELSDAGLRPRSKDSDGARG